ncbi:MAG: sugar ABC transporter substrate-binding protein [Clostridiales bacterium]|nr:sugar ABC transporter substrate-binding protein [Clostridiales bacterium]
MQRSLKIRALAAILLLIFVFALAACSKGGEAGGGADTPEAPVAPEEPKEAEPEAEAPAEEPEAAPAEKRTFAIIYPVIHPFFDPVTESAEKYVAEHEGFEVIIKAPESGDVQQQVEILENLIAMKVDGIAIGSTDADALAPIVDKAVDNGIPIITFDTDTPNSKRAGYIGTDNYNAGIHMAHVIAKHIGDKGEIIILQDVPTQLNLVDRLKGIEDTLKAEYPDIVIKDVQAGYADPAKSVEVLEALIQGHPDFDCYSGMGGAGGPAAIAVWKAKGWTAEDKKIITFDNIPENLDALREGIITALVSQNQHTWGEKIFEALNTLCDGGTIDEFDDTGTVEITIDNIDTYQDS